VKTVLITGASSGIGEILARQAGAHQWTVILGYHSGEERAERVAKEITRQGGHAFTIKMDLEQPKTIEHLVTNLSKKVQRLDALVLSASAPPEFLSFLELPPEIFIRQMTINAIAAQVLIAQTWKIFFEAQKTGHVVGLLSQAMKSPPEPFMTAYVAAKRALASVIESAAVELGRNGLCVSAVSPDLTETPMLKHLHPHLLEAVRMKAPGGRFLSAEEVARETLALLNNPPEPGKFFIKQVTPREAVR